MISGGALLLLAHGGPSPGKELVQAIVRPKIDEADENVGEIGLGLYAVQFASLDQRSEDGPIFGAVIVTREESILARKSLRAHGTLDDIGVELDAAVIKKADEAAPMPEAVADDPGGIRSAREPRELMLEEDLERVDEWARSYLARGTALIGTCAAHILLDGVDLGNARDGFGGDGRIAALCGRWGARRLPRCHRTYVRLHEPGRTW